MKIVSALQYTSSVQPKGAKSKSSRAKGTTSTNAWVGDSVELTGTSSQMSELGALLANQPAEDAGKVEAIRQAIANGTFKVDEEAVAEGLVRDTVEQLQHQHKR